MVESAVAAFARAGDHAFVWEPRGLASGVYLARLVLDGEQLATARLVLIK